MFHARRYVCVWLCLTPRLTHEEAWLSDILFLIRLFIRWEVVGNSVGPRVVREYSLSMHARGGSGWDEGLRLMPSRWRNQSRRHFTPNQKHSTRPHCVRVCVSLSYCVCFLFLLKSHASSVNKNEKKNKKKTVAIVYLATLLIASDCSTVSISFCQAN